MCHSWVRRLHLHPERHQRLTLHGNRYGDHRFSHPKPNPAKFFGNAVTLGELNRQQCS